VRRHLYFPASRAVLVPGLASSDRLCGTGVPLCDVFAFDIDFSPSKFFPFVFFILLLLFPTSHLSLLRPAEIFEHGNWELNLIGSLDAEDPEIKSLYADLKAAASLSKAASTFKTYAVPWSRFREWCASKNVPHLLAAPVVVALYMMKLLRTAASPAPILSFSSAVFLHHTMAGYASPTEHHLVRMARETAKRVRPAGQNKKHPFLASHLRRIISVWGEKSANLHELMMATTIVLGFTTFFRYDSLRLIDWDTIRFVGQSHMEVFVEKSKTDQYRVGTWSLVARVGGDF
jgi:hypothetical protein